MRLTYNEMLQLESFIVSDPFQVSAETNESKKRFIPGFLRDDLRDTLRQIRKVKLAYSACVEEKRATLRQDGNSEPEVASKLNSDTDLLRMIKKDLYEITMAYGIAKMLLDFIEEAEKKDLVPADMELSVGDLKDSILGDMKSVEPVENKAGQSKPAKASPNPLDELL